MSKSKSFFLYALCVSAVILAVSCSNKNKHNDESRNSDNISVNNNDTSKAISSDLPSLVPTQIPDKSPEITPMTDISGISGENDEEIKKAQKIIDDLMPLYREMNRLIYGGLDTYSEEIIEEESGHIYFVVKDNKYSSIDDIRSVMENVLTKDFISHSYYNWVLGGDYPYFKEVDGKLCVAMLDAVSTPLLSEVKGVNQMSESEMVLLMQEDTDDGIKDVLVTLKNVDGNWRIDSY